MIDDYDPWGKTERFDLFLQHVTRNPRLGEGRDVVLAFHRTQDIPFPVCVVTLMANYVEHIYVVDDWRRDGVATEVLRGIESLEGRLSMEAATEAGEAFCNAYLEIEEEHDDEGN